MWDGRYSIIKKVLFIFVFLLITQGQCYADDDFRGMTWGMSPQEVQKKEKLSLEKITYDIPDVDIYATTTKTGGIDCYLYYCFVKSKLCGGRYIFTKKNSNPDIFIIFIDDFNHIESILVEKYRKPLSAKRFFMYPDNKGISVAGGHGYMSSKWNLARENFILHNLTGNNFEIAHYIEYWSYATKETYDKLVRLHEKSGL